MEVNESNGNQKNAGQFIANEKEQSDEKNGEEELDTTTTRTLSTRVWAEKHSYDPKILLDKV